MWILTTMNWHGSFARPDNVRLSLSFSHPSPSILMFATICGDVVSTMLLHVEEMLIFLPQSFHSLQKPNYLRSWDVGNATLSTSIALLKKSNSLLMNFWQFFSCCFALSPPWTHFSIQAHIAIICVCLIATGDNYFSYIIPP